MAQFLDKLTEKEGKYTWERMIRLLLMNCIKIFTLHLFYDILIKVSHISEVSIRLELGQLQFCSKYRIEQNRALSSAKL